MAERKTKTSKKQQFSPKTHSYDRAVIVYYFLFYNVKNFWLFVTILFLQKCHITNGICAKN